MGTRLNLWILHPFSCGGKDHTRATAAVEISNFNKCHCLKATEFGPCKEYNIQTSSNLYQRATPLCVATIAPMPVDIDVTRHDIDVGISKPKTKSVGWMEDTIRRAAVVSVRLLEG